MVSVVPPENVDSSQLALCQSSVISLFFTCRRWAQYFQIFEITHGAPQGRCFGGTAHLPYPTASVYSSCEVLTSLHHKAS